MNRNNTLVPLSDTDSDILLHNLFIISNLGAGRQEMCFFMKYNNLGILKVSNSMCYSVLHFQNLWINNCEYTNGYLSNGKWTQKHTGGVTLNVHYKTKTSPISHDWSWVTAYSMLTAVKQLVTSCMAKWPRLTKWLQNMSKLPIFGPRNKLSFCKMNTLNTIFT